MTSLCQFCKYLPTSRDTFGCQPFDPDACWPCRKLAQLDEKITRMRETVIEMEKERLELKLQMNSTHDRLTRHLPLEITTEIFKLCLPTNIVIVSLKPVTSRYSLAAPLVLSAVSRRWRNIVRSTPQLWTDFPLRLHSLETEKMSSLLSVAKDWIERSGRRPLSININTHNGSVVEKLLKLVAQSSFRWTYLKYEGPPEALSYLSSDAEGISQLRKLILKNDSLLSPTFNLGKLILRPKYFETMSITTLKNVNVDWSHLVVLTLTNTGIFDCLEVLRNAPRIIHCALAPVVLTLYQFPQPQNPVVHRAIMSLSLAGAYFERLFAHLLCPSLKAFVVRRVLGPRLWMHTIIDFMRTSGCAVTELTLVNIEPSKEAINSLCQGIPTLRRLHIELGNDLGEVPVQECLFTLLAEVSTVGGKIESLYLPDLHMLRIFHNNVTLDWNLLPAVVRLPQNLVRHRSKLEYIWIWINRPPMKLINPSNFCIGKETQQQLLSLKELGVKIKIQFGPVQVVFI